MEVDHIFICTKYKAPEAELLKDFGLKEGTSNTHPGQGTSNRRFYFKNMMLELLWAEDITEVKNSRTEKMKLYERCLVKTKETSPFGIAFRPTIEENESAPFKTWDYKPLYLPDFLKIQVAEEIPLSEPMYFYLHFAKRENNFSEIIEVTNITIYTNREDELSDTANIINQLNNINIVRGKEHLMQLEFDGGIRNQTKDFRPQLPLIIMW